MTAVTDYRDNDRLAQALALVRELPPLSPMVRHLLASISGPEENTSLAEIAGLIEKDPITAGKVLALANSAFYARSAPILSVRHAVARLGVNALRNLVLSVSMTGLWKGVPTPKGWSTSRFNTHSIATAILSETIASVLAPESMDVAFLSGLFHDTGRLIIAVLLHDDEEAFERLSRQDHLQLEQAEFELVGFSHSELSASIVKSWKLPTAIETAVRFHENPAGYPERHNSTRVQLCDIVHVADCYVDCRGFSIQGELGPEEVAVRAFAQLGLGIEDSNMLTQFQEQLEILLSIL
jgi:HD-like signal output (HDOD) protein